MGVFLQTDRLLLSPLRSTDAPTLYRYRSTPEVSRFQGWSPASLEEVERFIERQREAEFDQPQSWFQLGIRQRDSEELVGDLGVHFLEAGSQQVELGVTVDPRHQRLGIAREAITRLLDYLFLELEKHRVIASVDPQNAPIRALLQRVGFREEGLFIESERIQGKWVDDLRFGLLRREWSSR